MEEKLGIDSYNNPKELPNQRSNMLNVCWHRKAWLIFKQNEFFFLNILIFKFFFSGGHFNNKMSFGPILFSQNYPDDPVGETLVDYFWLFRYSTFTLLRVLSTFTFQLRWFSWFFFSFGLGIAVLVDYFQAVRMFVIFFFFIIEFFPQISVW